MIKKIKKIIIDDWNRGRDEDTVLKNKFSTNLAFLISLVILVIPAVFLNEEIIMNNENLKTFIEYYSSFLPSIESRAMIAKENNLYYFAKLEGVLAIIAILSVFLILIVPISKVYLCILNIVECKESKYINSIIKKYKNGFSITQYLFVLLFMLFIAKGLFYSEHSSNMLNSMKYLFDTKVGIIVYVYFGSYAIGFILSFLTVETMAKLYKVYIKLYKFKL